MRNKRFFQIECDEKFSNQEINNLINEGNILRIELNELVSKQSTITSFITKLNKNRESEFNRQISQLNQQTIIFYYKLIQ